eukprot:CCRYP_010751-RA/>CCRYP_010751-RA protein AED:0.07 eAED:0.06 QI:553/0/0.5/1/1/1/2/0/709
MTSLNRPNQCTKGYMDMRCYSSLAVAVSKNSAKANAHREKFPEQITSPSQLKWHRTRRRRNNNSQNIVTLRPCRILSPEEAHRAKRKYNLVASTGHSLVQFLVYPNTTRGAYDSVVDDSLFPFYARGEWTLDEDSLGQYAQQQQKKMNNRDAVEAERLFLIRLFEHAVRVEKESEERAQKELEDYHHSNDSVEETPHVLKSPRNGAKSKDTSEDEDDVLESPRPLFEFEEDTAKECIDDEFLDAPYTQAINFDPDINNLDDGISNEPIRPGDVIEYYSPIFVVGDKRGLRQATVLYVDPKADVILRLSNGECLPEDTRVKRIKVIDGNDLVDHPGIYRPIETFKLVAGKAKGYNTGDGIMNEAARFGDIFRKNMNKMKASAEAEGFAPMDMVLKLNGGRRANHQDASVKSSSLTKKTENPTLRNKDVRPPLSPSSSSDSSTRETSKFRRLAPKQPPLNSKRTTTIPKQPKGNSDQVLHHSSSSSSSGDDNDQTLSEVRREKNASNCVSIFTSPEKITCTSRNSGKENVDNCFVVKKKAFGSASSPASLGTSLASSPASLGPSLASSPASLGTSLASSSDDDDSVGVSPAKCCKVNPAHSSPKVGSVALDLSTDLSSESSSERLTKKDSNHKKRGASSIQTLSDDDISDSDDEKPHFRDKRTKSKSSRKSLQSQLSSFSHVTTGGWTRGKGGWVKAADVPGFSLAFSRHK